MRGDGKYNQQSCKYAYKAVIYLFENGYIALFHEVQLEIYELKDAIDGCDLLTQGGGCFHR